VQALHGVLGRVLRHHEARPALVGEVLQRLALAGGRQVLQQLRALRAELADHLELALVGQRTHRRAVDEHREVDLSAAEVLHQRRVALVRHVLQLDAGGLLHILEDEVVERADAHAAIGQRPVGRLACQRDQLVHVFHAEVGTGHEHHHRVGHRMHEAEVLGPDLDRGVGQRREDHLVGRTLEDVVAVGRCAEHLLRRQRTADAPEVLDDDLLAEILAHRRVHDARDRVRRAAGRIRDHQVDGLGRIRLRPCGAAGEREAGGHGGR
jgi:hypothetical protein